MRTIHLHGRLAAFGGPYAMDAASPAEALRGLLIQIEGLRQAIDQGVFKVLRGGLDDGLALDAEELRLGFGRCEELHVVPVVAGADKGGTAKLIVGAALIATALVFAPPVVGAMGPTLGMGTTAFSVLGASVTFADIAMVGVGLALTGVSTLLAPQANSTASADAVVSREQPDQRASFLFSGPVNTIEQGQPVPLIYGRVRVGSIAVSSALDVENIGPGW